MVESHSLRALQAFEAAARRGSFALAADELGVSPAAISQLIRGLENRTGRQLFERVKRGIQLSEAGRDVYPRLTMAFQDVREVSEVLRHRVAPSKLTISVPPSVATCWLPDKLGNFLAQEPNTSVRMREDQDPIDLEVERIDLRLSYGSFPSQGAKVVAQVSDTVVAVCTKDYFEKHNSHTEPNFFPTGHLISTDWGNASARFPSWSDFLGEDIRRPMHTVSSSHAALSLAQAGLGVALIQKLYAAKLLRSNYVVLASPQDLTLAQSYCVSARVASMQRPLTKRFSEWFVAQLQTELATPSSPEGKLSK